MDKPRRAPAPSVDYTIDHTDPIALLQKVSDGITRAGHFASEHMQDHLGDRSIVNDMHRLLNALVVARDCAVLAREILEDRRDDAAAA